MRTFSKGQQQNKGSLDAHSIRNSTCTDTYVRNYEEDERSISIGKYKISLDDILGQGYSSKVYKGTEEGKPFKKYAVKVIEWSKFSSSCRELFEKEIKIHRNLNHENIVKCHDVFKTKKYIFMIMEYCPHGDLHSFIQQKRKISEHTIADIMNQVLSGYRYLADLKILHRDLKPANILRIGKVWKISDFGFSTRQDKGFFDSVNVGTPMYMPIESLQKSFYSIKSDIFALGVILYELIHAQVPWYSKSQDDLVRKMLKNKLSIKKQIKNQKIKDFILKACEITDQKRLDETELKNYHFSTQHSLFQSIFLPSARDSQKKEDFVRINDEILVSELNLCKLVFDMIQNIQSFLLSLENKSSFLMTLLKFLLKTIKTLENKNFQSEKLVNFDEYKQCENYLMIQHEIHDFLAKYEKTYLDYIKVADIKYIRIVNGKFPQFTKNSQLPDKQFHLKLKLYLSATLKQNENRLANLIKDERQSEPNMAQYLEAFSSLCIFLKAIELKASSKVARFQYKSLERYCLSKLKRSDFVTLHKQIMHI